MNMEIDMDIDEIRERKDDCPFCNGVGFTGILDPDNFTNNRIFGLTNECKFCDGTGKLKDVVIIQLKTGDEN